MVIAVVAMRVMKMSVDQIIDMISMRYRLVSAAWAVDVARFMAAAIGRTFVRIFSAHLDLVLVYMITMWMVQMAVMKIIYVIAVLDRGVSAARTMLMLMGGMMRFVACAHPCLLSSLDCTRASNVHPNAFI